jgi:hypothetical protein
MSLSIIPLCQSPRSKRPCQGEKDSHNEYKTNIFPTFQKGIKTTSPPTEPGKDYEQRPNHPSNTPLFHMKQTTWATIEQKNPHAI